MCALNYWKFVFVIMVLIIATVENRVLFTLTNIECKSLDPALINITLCEMKAVQRNVKETSVHINVDQNPIDDVQVYFIVKRRGYEHLKPLYEVNIDGCAFMRNKRRNPIANIAFKLSNFEKFSNLNHSCPFYNGFFVNKARVDESVVSLLPLPVGDYSVVSTWSMHKIPRVQIIVRFKMQNL